MMKNPEQTIGNMADKCGTVFMSYIDDEGFPVTKAMLKPSTGRDPDVLVSYKYLVKQSEILQGKSKSQHLFCRYPFLPRGMSGGKCRSAGNKRS